MPVTNKCEEDWRSLLSEGSSEATESEEVKDMREAVEPKNGAESESGRVKFSTGIGEGKFAMIGTPDMFAEKLKGLLDPWVYYHIEVDFVAMEDDEVCR